MPDATLSFDHLVTLLQNAEARFRIIHHPAEGTSEAVARIRGTDPGQGAKAMLCQIKELPETLVLAILPGNLKIDFRKVAERTLSEATRTIPAQEMEQCLSVLRRLQAHFEGGLA